HGAVRVILSRHPEAEADADAVPLLLRDLLIVLGKDLTAGSHVLAKEGCVAFVAKLMREFGRLDEIAIEDSDLPGVAARAGAHRFAPFPRLPRGGTALPQDRKSVV